MSPRSVEATYYYVGALNEEALAEMIKGVQIEREIEGNSSEGQTELRQIGLRHGTDKVSHHHYEYFYTRYLAPFRNIRNAGLFEVGIDQGNSLGTWLEYFPHAFVYGIDIGTEGEGERHRIWRCDQTDVSMLSGLIEKHVKHSIFAVIDDGSHIPQHQVLTFNLLFDKLLCHGGVYVIEDIEVSYWTKGSLYGYETRYGYRHPSSVVEVFKHVVDEINEEFLTEASRDAQSIFLTSILSEPTRTAISTVTFGRNCVIVTKKTRAELAAGMRKYRSPEKL